MGYRLDLPHPRLLIKIPLELPPFVKSNAHTGFVGPESAVVVGILGVVVFKLHVHVDIDIMSSMSLLGFDTS
jgi:hypothetical protein